MAYEISITAHSWVRWALLVAGIGTLVLAVRGWRGARPWSPAQERLAAALLGLADLQLLLGLALLLWTSPIATVAWQLGLRVALDQPLLLFFGYLHPLAMIVGFVVLKVGRARVRRAADDHAKQRTMALSVIAWLALVLVAIPWPGLLWGRPLVP